MKKLSILLFLLIPILLYSQTKSKSPRPTFTPFSGTVYKMPKVKRQIGDKTFIGLQERYGNNIYDYEEIGKIGLKQLNIPETNIYERNFPGVKQKIKFAMVLHAEMEVSLEACYEFSLSSDDGSILWIDSTLIVNNDGGHQMTLKKDSMVFKKGKYPVKVWYFQGMPDRYGLILDAKIAGKPAVCPVKPKKVIEQIILSEVQTLAKKIPSKENFSLNSNILFEMGKATLKDEAINEIKRIAEIINKKSPKTILISGHTDNTGNLPLNQTLSIKRATEVMEKLQIFLKDSRIHLSAIGKANTEPIATNKTKEGRAKNRRVEFTFNH